MDDEFDEEEEDEGKGGIKTRQKKCGIFHKWVDFILFLASGPLMGSFLKKNYFFPS